ATSTRSPLLATRRAYVVPSILSAPRQNPRSLGIDRECLIPGLGEDPRSASGVEDELVRPVGTADPLRRGRAMCRSARVRARALEEQLALQIGRASCRERVVV